MLAQYNDIVPNGAERLVALAERQVEHRQSLESAVIHANIRAESRGQTFAFLLALIVVVGGILLIAFNKDVQGLAAIITAFVGLAAVFIYGRWQQKQERERKRREADVASGTKRQS
jgi:uncharacterized membrane protein